MAAGWPKAEAHKSKELRLEKLCTIWGTAEQLKETFN